MTANQYRAAIAKLALTQEGAGLWLGLSARQGQRYANGEAEIPGPVAIILWLTLKGKITVDDVNAVPR
jgi:hypothetical protein